jgi:hypothetical protein
LRWTKIPVHHLTCERPLKGWRKWCWLGNDAVGKPNTLAVLVHFPIIDVDVVLACKKIKLMSRNVLLP